MFFHLNFWWFDYDMLWEVSSMFMSIWGSTCLQHLAIYLISWTWEFFVIISVKSFSIPLACMFSPSLKLISLKLGLLELSKNSYILLFDFFLKKLFSECSRTSTLFSNPDTISSYAPIKLLRLSIEFFIS